MIPIYDRYSQLVGWINQGSKMIFDTNMRWLGFETNGYIFTNNCKWIGGWNNGTIVDQFGKPLGWTPGNTPQGCAPLLTPLVPLRPLTPLMPIRPIQPLRPLRQLDPIGGWSDIEWGKVWK